ncbi:MAG: hypothetical protein IJQ33_11115 [Clostridia bacterium]|nr:hypothetical protein [Clostridia bacterium]
MRRLVCILLAFCLLWVMPGWAEETEPNLKYYESAYGFSFLYDADQFWLFDQFPPETDEKADAAHGFFSEDWFQLPTPAAVLLPKALYEESAAEETNGLPYVPLNEDIQAGLVILQPFEPDPSWPPAEDDEIEMERPLDLSVPYGYVSNPGKADILYISLSDASFYIYVYAPDDDAIWKEKMWDVLSTLEFPPQPAVNEDFRLDFFQGGAAGMQFSDLVVDEDADPFVIVPLREMTGFALEYLDWDFCTMEPTVLMTVYSAAVLSPGDNLRVSCYFEDVMPNLRLRYTDAEGEAQCFFLFQSGRDGSLLLLTESEL